MTKNILHIGFHLGLANELYYIAEKLKLDMTFMKFTDGVSTGAKLYNIGHNRAEVAWNNNKDFYNKFDIIITSDTCPISRVFLQNNYQGYLIIYVCNRFDYYDRTSLDCDFPDKEYYDLINTAKSRKNVKIISYTEFEHVYAKIFRHVDIGNQVIKPIGKISNEYLNKSFKKVGNTSVPKDTENLFFVPPYHNDTILMNLSRKLNELNIPNYTGKYQGPQELINFKGIIHIPYAWSNIALFENIQLGIIYFVPTMNFLLKLKRVGNFYWTPPFSVEYLKLSEWYCESHKNILIYFDSWKDLQNKVKNLDYEKQKTTIKEFAKKHEIIMLDKWKKYLTI